MAQHIPSSKGILILSFPELVCSELFYLLYSRTLRESVAKQIPARAQHRTALSHIPHAYLPNIAGCHQPSCQVCLCGENDKKEKEVKYRVKKRRNMEWKVKEEPCSFYPWGKKENGSTVSPCTPYYVHSKRRCDLISWVDDGSIGLGIHTGNATRSTHLYLIYLGRSRRPIPSKPTVTS
ncbi:hypothetical protein An15g01040 [Aspergillus niger]|uniref:Uncharacterized protein n=2 Tax=Aspergillus niger TaxID=5061 RepID=A2R4N5_ASPNC|nr:hypothetical protein An15g01040 [Aspergillus niger]CAK42273.1 hypothetical protein An15g01040 [Aspergillus niger]